MSRSSRASRLWFERVHMIQHRCAVAAARLAVIVAVSELPLMLRYLDLWFLLVALTVVVLLYTEFLMIPIAELGSTSIASYVIAQMRLRCSLVAFGLLALLIQSSERQVGMLSQSRCAATLQKPPLWLMRRPYSLSTVPYQRFPETHCLLD